MTVETAPTPGPPLEFEQPQYNIKALLRHVGGIWHGGASPSLEDRPEPEHPAELLDDEPASLWGVQPGEVYGFVDGTQASMRLTYREHRPIVLQHVAAGCLGARESELTVERHRLSVVCAPDDVEWVLESGSGIPVETVEGGHPAELERRTGEVLAGKREQLEREVIVQALSASKNDGGLVVVDGHIVGRPEDPRCVGVVKSANSRYLANEEVLFSLKAGWRSPRFVLRGQGIVRYSAYVRLFDAEHHAWDHGLIRVEAFNPEILDAVGALALHNRQAPGADGRWDRHITGIANVERYLRARRSPVFDS